MSYHSSESDEGEDDEAPRDAAFAWGLGLVLLLVSFLPVEVHTVRVHKLILYH